ncbi:MAG: hypothetical protein ACK5JR_17150 [Tropicimonas sp.]|uniref:hypothetical protein n=1 Tax=Tropicimonas sp. TaxID=2067044 RepID=UPI003A83ACB1
MKPFTTIKSFSNDESGGVTVDWVVLVAAVAGLVIAVMAVVRGGVEGLATEVGTQVTASERLDTSTD